MPLGSSISGCRLPPADRTIRLDFNGNRLVDVLHDSRSLNNMWDFNVRGDQLIVKAAFLDSLTRGKAYGVNAVLTLRFERGVPWRIHVITYDEPVLSAATATTSDFAIPTAFTGDQLATMEAKYADGTFAGPHNWTAFKEFDVAFKPDYTGSKITLPTTFFNEIKADTPVTLTFHFWSGAKVNYTVTKSGTAVTGSPA